MPDIDKAEEAGMRVVLFETNWRSWISLVISFVTRSPYSHAAVEIDGEVFDASEKRGDVGVSTSLEEDDERRVLVLDLPASRAGASFVEASMGIPYDWHGVLGWLWNGGHKERFYCFELAYLAAKRALKRPAKPLGLSVGPEDILRLGLPIHFYGTAGDYKRTLASR